MRCLKCNGLISSSAPVAGRCACPPGLIDDEQKVPAENFLQTLAANVDNDKLSAAGFREFVRNTLPIVIFPRKNGANNGKNEATVPTS